MPMDWGRFGKKGAEETQVTYHTSAVAAPVGFTQQTYVSEHHLSDEQHEALLKSAVQVDHLEGAKEPETGNQVITQTIKRKVHVPVEKEVRVPVVSKKVETRMEKKVVEGTKMVPIKKYKDVTETVLETKEEVVHGFKERWVKVKEPTTEVVKKQVPVTRTRRVSYVDYVEQKVQKVVEVPKEVVSEVHGFRVDKHIGTKVVEVEEDVQYEMRPVYVRNGERRVRETGDVYHHGKMIHGKEVYNTGEQIITEGVVNSSRYVDGESAMYSSGGYVMADGAVECHRSGGAMYSSGGATYSGAGYVAADGDATSEFRMGEGQQIIDQAAVMRAAGMQMTSGGQETSEMQKDGDGVMWRSVVTGETQYGDNGGYTEEYVTTTTHNHEHTTTVTTEECKDCKDC